MARIPQNKLTLVTLSNGSFKLFGYFQGVKIRRQSRDGGKLKLLKEKLEGKLEEIKSGTTLRSTWLSEDQLREAEAATRAAGDMKLTEAVAAAKAAEQAVAEVPIKWPDAVAAWCEYLQTSLRRFPATVTKNRVRLTAFSKQLAGAFVHEAKAEEVEKWILRPDLAARTQITDGSVLRAFFRHAVKRRWCSASPVEIDLSELTHRAGAAVRPKILTPSQCAKLLAAARESFGGELLPFVVLSTWCFMRKAEVMRTTLADIDLAHGRVEINPRKQGTASYRTVNIPENALRVLKGCVEGGMIKAGEKIRYNRSRFDAVRAAAGLITWGERKKKHGRREVLESVWQDNILRHTGISYLYSKSGDIKEVCRQAGNSSDTSFKHYLQLPEPGAAQAFYSL